MPESVAKYWPILAALFVGEHGVVNVLHFALSPEQQAAVEALRVQVEALRK